MLFRLWFCKKMWTYYSKTFAVYSNESINCPQILVSKGNEFPSEVVKNENNWPKKYTFHPCSQRGNSLLNFFRFQSINTDLGLKYWIPWKNDKTHFREVIFLTPHSETSNITISCRESNPQAALKFIRSAYFSINTLTRFPPNHQTRMKWIPSNSKTVFSTSINTPKHR